MDPSASQDFPRLLWTIRDLKSYPDAILVADDISDPNSVLRRLRDPETGAFHPIASSLVSGRPVQSFTVSIWELDHWEDNWQDEHELTADDPDEFKRNENAVLIKSFGQKRPPPGPKLVIEASTERGVTIGDYIQAVHQWLLKHDCPIREALAQIQRQENCIEMVLVVGVVRPSLLNVDDIAEEDVAFTYRISRSSYHKYLRTKVASL